MNTRIKELAKQAKKFATKNETYNLAFVMADFEQKFAELIVRECILQCKEALVPPTGQPSMTHNYAVGLCQDKIQEYFGVKE